MKFFDSIELHSSSRFLKHDNYQRSEGLVPFFHRAIVIILPLLSIYAGLPYFQKALPQSWLSSTAILCVGYHATWPNLIWCCGSSCGKGGFKLLDGKRGAWTFDCGPLNMRLSLILSVEKIFRNLVWSDQRFASLNNLILPPQSWIFQMLCWLIG